MLLVFFFYLSPIHCTVSVFDTLSELCLKAHVTNPVALGQNGLALCSSWIMMAYLSSCILQHFSLAFCHRFIFLHSYENTNIQ